MVVHRVIHTLFYHANRTLPTENVHNDYRGFAPDCYLRHLDSPARERDGIKRGGFSHDCDATLHRDLSNHAHSLINLGDH